MRILVSNDDGIEAEGIKALVAELKKAHEVWVAAPERQQSGVGHCFTMWPPLTAEEKSCAEATGWAVPGTPTDCVRMGIKLLTERAGKPDIVVSGINRGSNLGDEVIYSGTAAAAIESVLQGLPAIAVSLCCANEEPDGKYHFDTAALAAVKAVAYLCRHPLPSYTMLNVNVPNLPKEQILGVRCTRLCRMPLNMEYEKAVSPRGVEYYLITPAQRWPDDSAPDNDANLVRRGFIALTPVKTDCTDYASLAAMEETELFDIHD